MLRPVKVSGASLEGSFVLLFTIEAMTSMGSPPKIAKLPSTFWTPVVCRTSRMTSLTVFSSLGAMEKVREESRIPSGR